MSSGCGLPASRGGSLPTRSKLTAACAHSMVLPPFTLIT